jgi:hypothetical protein
MSVLGIPEFVFYVYSCCCGRGFVCLWCVVLFCVLCTQSYFVLNMNIDFVFCLGHRLKKEIVFKMMPCDSNGVSFA